MGSVEKVMNLLQSSGKFILAHVFILAQESCSTATTFFFSVALKLWWCEGSSHAYGSLCSAFAFIWKDVEAVEPVEPRNVHAIVALRQPGAAACCPVAVADSAPTVRSIRRCAAMTGIQDQAWQMHRIRTALIGWMNRGRKSSTTF